MRFLLSRYLSQFVAVYDHGSLRAAADIVGVSQPALSKSLKQLETLLDVVLFDRQPNGLAPTPFAHKLREKANIILKEAEITQLELRALKNNVSGQIKSSAGPVWLGEIIPNVLPALYNQFPDIEMEISLERGDFAIPKIASGDLDLYFGALPPSLDQHGLTNIPLMELEIRFYARTDHLIHKTKKANRALKMSEYPWAGFTTHDTVTDLVEADVERAGAHFHKLSFGLDSISALAKLGQSTDHIVMAPQVVERAFAAYDLKPISNAPTKLPFPAGIVCRSSFVHYEPIKFLIQTTRQHCADMISEISR